jgi:hypothetical protein
VALVRADAQFHNGKLIERPDGTDTAQAASKAAESSHPKTFIHRS